MTQIIRPEYLKKLWSQILNQSNIWMVKLKKKFNYTKGFKTIKISIRRIMIKIIIETKLYILLKHEIKKKSKKTQKNIQKNEEQNLYKKINFILDWSVKLKRKINLAK